MALSLPHTIEALLFAAGEALPRKRVITMLSITEEMLTAALQELSQDLSARGIVLVQTDSEIELRTAPEASAIIEEYRKSELSRDLGKAGLEALAIILYQNGATRSEIDWIRGVNSTTAIRSLLLRGLIEREADSEDKRRIRYTPSLEAFAHLGVTGFSELPNAETVRALLTQHTEQGTATAE